MTTIAKARVVIVGEDQTGPAFAGVSRQFDRLSASTGAIIGKLGAIGAAVGGAAGALRGLSRAIALLDKLDDLSEKTGISVERLSELRYAGEVTGTSFEALTGGIGRLGKTMAEAAGGNKEAVATFEALGVEIFDAQGKLRGTEEVLADIAQRF